MTNLASERKQRDSSYSFMTEVVSKLGLKGATLPILFFGGGRRTCRQRIEKIYTKMNTT